MRELSIIILLVWRILRVVQAAAGRLLLVSREKLWFRGLILWNGGRTVIGILGLDTA
jgi:hypothetical protein